MQNKIHQAAAAALTLFAAAAWAGPVGIDGVIGAEWGAATAHVDADPAAPTSNFGTPGHTNAVGYSVYFRGDADYLYAAVAADTPTGLNFANIYFNVDNQTGPTSDLGVEVTNNNFFIPSTGMNALDAGGYLDYAVGSSVVEFAIAWSFLYDDPYALGFNKAVAGQAVTMTLSQSFGYSVAGDPGFYGASRLGSVVAPAAASVPEPGSLALVGLALAGLALGRRRAR